MKLAVIQPGFWLDQQQVNARRAIFHQWQQLEASGCIENFRIAAGEVVGFREGYYFADSDAYKWLDAAARIWACQADPGLERLMDDFIALLGRAQMPDGYIFTYNQIHFPADRWKNLQVEHELYCHGHLIEAGISHFEATGREDLLIIARRAADRIVADFNKKGPAYTPGHEEIEIALLRLHQVTADPRYYDLARQFVEQRGRTPFFAISIYRQNNSANRRTRFIQNQKTQYLAAHPDFKPFQLPGHNQVKAAPFSKLRWYISSLQGKYFQQHAPIRRQTTPVGHTVRFTYLETAAAMLARSGWDAGLRQTLERAWERMITRRMFVTGGIGSLDSLEGFGRDYELDPEFAYAETCAALGSLFWNWEMAQMTGQAQYSDLFEWQLYNAAAVGMGAEGTTYLYNNPLVVRGGKTRQAWYSCPCCPSNLSRTWASLGKYIYSVQPGAMVVHQYVSSACSGAGLSLEMQSELPWQGNVRLKINSAPAGLFEIRLRRPSWADGIPVAINREPAIPDNPPVSGGEQFPSTASGYDPRLAGWTSFRREWAAGDEIEIHLPMQIQLRRTHPRLRGHAGKVAVTRGPLVYCLESVDNPGIDIFSARLDPETLQAEFDPSLLGGMVKILARTDHGEPLTFIPYFRWGNRGESQMTVWVNG